jgi:hypothetical protein
MARARSNTERRSCHASDSNAGGVGILFPADEFFFLAHGESGRARLHLRATGLGLAAALLGELVFYQRIDIAPGGVVQVVRADPPEDLLAHTTLDRLLGQPTQHDVRTWLAVLEATSVDAVGQRLARGGYVQVVERRRLLRSRVSYVPVSLNQAAWPGVRLARLMTTADAVSEPDALLAGLVAATDLLRQVLPDQNAYSIGAARLPQLLRCLRPSLCDLVAYTEAAVGDAVLVPR